MVPEVVAVYRWHVITPEGLEAELAAAGLTVSHGPHGLLRATAG